MSHTYTRYHMHTDYSLLDSATNIDDYIALALKEGCTALGISDHGVNRGWFEHYQKCREAGLKFLNGVEIYLTEDLNARVRDNYHTVLIARDREGRLELNRLIELSTRDDHRYYNNRLSFDEFLQISDHIIKISACVASPLQRLPDDHPMYLPLAEHYDYLEIQHHNAPVQKEYNQRLYQLAQKLGKPLIAGTDTHASSVYKKECRDILMLAKGQSYPEEDAFDLVWKTYDELVEAYRIQGVLPEDVYLEAIENTNRMAESVADEEIDTSIKYPILYGSRERDSSMFEQTIWRMFDEKLRQGIIPSDEESAFRTAITEELRVFQKLQMDGFMLSMSELVRWCHENGIVTGPCRGSVGGSCIAYVTDIIDMNPIELNTVFSRFANEDRVEAGDIDIDVVTDDRPRIFQHVIDRFGVQHTARVGSYGTLADLAIIDDVGRALKIKWENAHDTKKQRDNPWSLTHIKQIKKVYKSDPEKARKDWNELFYYYDGLTNVKISQSVHPAGMVISPIDLDAEYGVMNKDGERCLTLSMDEVHDIGGIKYDFLGLKSLKVVKDACDLIGIPFPRYHMMDWNDAAVWQDISDNPAGLFQFESSFGAESVRQFKPKSIDDLSLVTACIRPSGASYRDLVFAHKVHHNPTAQMDELFSDTYGFVVYQEQIIQALMVLCGFTGGQADTVRRHITKKQKEAVERDIVSIRDGYCALSPLPREQAEEEAAELLKVIEDASGYSFGKNHSCGYCLITYMFGYLRYYHPVEFITAYLNNAKEDEDIQTGTVLAKQYNCTVQQPKFGFAKDSYFCDVDSRVITQGVAYIKNMSSDAGSKLYQLSQENEYQYFTDLLRDIRCFTRVNTSQVQTLIDIDFFDCFGNQTELDAIYETCLLVSYGDAKRVKREKVDGTWREQYFRKYANYFRKSGGESTYYTINDMIQLLHEMEKHVLSCGLNDRNLYDKVRRFQEVMGFAGFTTGREQDRSLLYIKDIFPLRRKVDNKLFGYSVITQSIGSGIESRFTVMNKLYNEDPVIPGDIIRCMGWLREGKYFRMTGYRKMRETDFGGMA